MGDRRLAAKLAEDLYSGKIDYDKFNLLYPENDLDKALLELFDLIEHEPAVGSFFGESQDEHNLRMKRIRELIQELKK